MRIEDAGWEAGTLTTSQTCPSPDCTPICMNLEVPAVQAARKMPLPRGPARRLGYHGTFPGV